MNIEIIKHAAIDVLKNTPYKPFLCLPMSAVLYAMLKDNHGVDAKLITGDLTYKNHYIFNQNFSIRSEVSNSLKYWAGHAWVEVRLHLRFVFF